MNKNIIFALVGGIFLFLSTLQAQEVTMSVSHIPLDQLTIGDIDFQTGGSRSWFFTVNVEGPPRQVVLYVQADIQLPDANFTNAIHFTTEKFSIPKTFTNLDLGSGSEIKIKPGTRVEFNEDAKTRIQNEALATGKLPAGTYAFNLVIQDTTEPTTLSSTQIVLTLRNISRLDLISPRDNEEVPNPFPLFQWIFDGTRVEISIYERLPQHQSKEEAAQGTPHLVQELTDVRSFQYPSTASRPLEAGKTYVWKVRGFTSGSGGVGNIINSEIWQFTVSAGGGPGNSPTGGGGGGGGGSGQQQNFMNQLQSIPGIPPQFMNQLTSGNLQLTGVILVNGLAVSPAQLIAILNDLSQNPDKIIEVNIIERR